VTDNNSLAGMIVMVRADFRWHAVVQLVEAQRYKPEGIVLDPG
jgi:hypothetical protein